MFNFLLSHPYLFCCCYFSQLFGECDAEDEVSPDMTDKEIGEIGMIRYFF